MHRGIAYGRRSAIKHCLASAARPYGYPRCFPPPPQDEEIRQFFNGPAYLTWSRGQVPPCCCCCCCCCCRRRRRRCCCCCCCCRWLLLPLLLPLSLLLPLLLPPPPPPLLLPL
eukprot:SAG11_NODE_14353_length_614_cov_1.538760_1_plen_112_part_01